MTPGNHGEHIFSLEIEIVITKIVNSKSLKKICRQLLSTMNGLKKSIPWRLAEFYYNRCLQRPYAGTCIILQETINKFLCPLIVDLKSKTQQRNLKDVIKLNKNLR